MRLKQVYYQVWYRVKHKYYKKNYKGKVSKIVAIHWNSPLRYRNSWYGNSVFKFLNLEKSFETIDWNYSDYGKLWTYNLTYFDFLNQDQITKEDGIGLIRDFIANKESLKDALEPYPLSLRGMNWVKFLTEHQIKDVAINSSLFNDYCRLRDNLEFHLLGNHLLENGFSLIFGATYFDNENWYNKGKQIVVAELSEQVLPDGAHFELSPMYHQIILHRILDSIQLFTFNTTRKDNLLPILKKKAVKMLGWLEAVTFKSGAIPMVNDAAYDIAPSTGDIFEYAAYLGLEWRKTVLKESGYRKWDSENYECFMDMGQIGPDYIPGHAHSDILNFVLQVNEQPFIVDTGTSTYEKNELRHQERSTKSHNTVVVNNRNQTEVWGGFRVARRAKIITVEEREDGYTASHDGYKRLGVIHKRSFVFTKDEINIRDTLVGESAQCTAYFHFHPSLKIIVKANTVQCKELETQINFKGDAIKVEKANYNLAEGFNRTTQAIVVQVSFANELTTTICFKRT